MRFHIMTLFPEIFNSYFGESIMKRAIEKGIIEVFVYNIRDFSANKHKKVDDYPFGGGAGMLMTPQPIYDTYKHIVDTHNIENPRVIYLTPKGKTLKQGIVKGFSKEEDIILLCGHYEGIDQRIIDLIVTDEISIGDYVLEEACRQCRYWNEHGIPDFHINVNLSVVQLLQKDVAETVARILKKTGVNPKNIVLEITESFAINDMDRVLDIIKGIKKLGPRIALDDFGTGYSSLNYIKQLPLDIIKVDKTFIDDIVDDEYAQAFIKLIVELSDTIDTDIIVEGVENEAQLNILKELGVDYIQGFYYGKPVPAYEFVKLNFRGRIDYENADKEW